MLIYFDLDGVLADFKGFIFQKFGRPFESSMWLEIHEKFPRLYRDLEPIPKMVEVFKDMKRCNDVKILTALPSRVTFEFAEEDKRQWCKEHLGDVEVIVSKNSFSKQFQCTGNGEILIDDNEMNVSQWNAAGGVGLLVLDKTVLGC